MADLTKPPPKPGPGGAAGARILRDRVQALSGQLDRPALPNPHGAARQVLQIYNGGSMPSATDHYFLGHPVRYSGASAEGVYDPGVVDTQTSVPVLVLRGVPSVGDQLVATAVGGRWVAEMGGVSQPCNCETQCGLCVFSKGDLTVVYRHLAFDFCFVEGGTATLNYDPLVGWTSGPIESECGIFYLSAFCGTNSTLGLLIGVPSSVVAAGGLCCSTGPGCNAPLYLTSFTCNPLSATFDAGYGEFNLCPFLNAGSTFAVTGPPPATGPPPICETFRVFGCSYGGLSGATVSVYASNGGALVVSGVTSASGTVSFSWVGSPGNYYVTVTEPSGRFQDFAGTLKLDCGQRQIVLVPAAGYACASCCPLPLAVELSWSTSGCDPDSPQEGIGIYEAGTGKWMDRSDPLNPLMIMNSGCNVPCLTDATITCAPAFEYVCSVYDCGDGNVGTRTVTE